MEENVHEFMEEVTGGTKNYEEFTLVAPSGNELTVEIHPFGKTKLGSVVERLPTALFDAAENGDDIDDLSGDNEMAKEAMSEQSVEAFEDMCKWSFQHDQLSPPEINQLVKNLSFEVLFEAGGRALTMSFEENGKIENFRGQE